MKPVTRIYNFYAAFLNSFSLPIFHVRTSAGGLYISYFLSHLFRQKVNCNGHPFQGTTYFTACGLKKPRAPHINCWCQNDTHHSTGVPKKRRINSRAHIQVWGHWIFWLNSSQLPTSHYQCKKLANAFDYRQKVALLLFAHPLLWAEYAELCAASHKNASQAFFNQAACFVSFRLF